MARCCPRGHGCNIGPGVMQPCHMRCALKSTDVEAAEATAFWWNRYSQLRFWQRADRREAYTSFVNARDRALQAPRQLPPLSLFKALDKPGASVNKPAAAVTTVAPGDSNSPN